MNKKIPLFCGIGDALFCLLGNLEALSHVFELSKRAKVTQEEFAIARDCFRVQHG